ncbi:MAG: threonylcarbamoyl-AMP synthase [Ignavibacteria bacterium]|nr:threonylcarbamoyl-AMP synthase [Ignavibacteria bacterium]MBI3765708.1 threonylcarbamoyl-AMP synthase [Ignavibacteriales bacterium]
MVTVARLTSGKISTHIVDDAAAVIRKGGVLIYPTDTIYGLGCDAFNADAIRRIFEIKRRPETRPALVLARSISMVKELVTEISPMASQLMKQFWPGPLTIILRAKRKVNSYVVSPDGKIGIRVPNHRFCLRLIGTCETPVISTSANISGHDTPKNVRALVEMFSSSVDLVVDAGNLRSILPSTVVDVSDGTLNIVREGSISRERLQRFLKSVA